ncbi:DUF397 domain-containing protein [Streptomyces sp. ACA25]|uniref:DUF397 domain-containing protein n=1 Tax=Streptomyces sp. ACA25 TaxID=3022596 RepID=UPI002307FE4A|nr:DUF397 domain-containing protein [Streptomyces sp. ACA25]MDB1088592.1 DUF397 domain-containing protein [Streptomyces sp. ACA25]
MNPPCIVSAFRKSSYSGGAVNDCVEVARTSDGGRAVRDSKCSASAVQHCSPGAWTAFLRAVRADTFTR